MILKLKLKNIDDNYAWHFVDGVENVAVEKTELGNIKSITYKKKGDPDVTNLVLYKESRGFLAAEAYILNNEGKTIENLVSSQSQSKTPSHKFSKTFGVVGFDKEIVVGNRDADDDVLAKLAQKSEKEGIPIVIRHVVVPGITDSKEELEKLGKEIAHFRNLKGLDLLPYHSMGISKYEIMGMEYPLSGVKDMEKSRIK